MNAEKAGMNAALVTGMLAGTLLLVGIGFASWIDEPRPAPAFDVMLDSASPGLKTHPCATDPNRACMSLSIRGMPLEKP